MKQFVLSCDEDCFVSENELTVTITLHEYKNLVTDNALMKEQISSLKNEIRTLNSNLQTYQKAFLQSNPEIAESLTQLLRSFGNVLNPQQERVDNG